MVVEFKRTDTNAVVSGSIQKSGKSGTDINVPTPGQPDIKVTITTSEETSFIYETAEKLPRGTRMAIKPADLASPGVAGGHTRASWEAVEKGYGDVVKKTGDQQISFALPGSRQPIDVSKINYEVMVTKGGTTTATPAINPKTIFEKSDDLDAFETHARPYIAGKMDSLRGKKPPSGPAPYIDVEVPVTTASGAEATLVIQFPWRVDANLAPIVDTWFIAQKNFARGSAFNP